MLLETFVQILYRIALFLRIIACLESTILCCYFDDNLIDLFSKVLSFMES